MSTLKQRGKKMFKNLRKCPLHINGNHTYQLTNSFKGATRPTMQENSTKHLQVTIKDTI